MYIPNVDRYFFKWYTIFSCACPHLSDLSGLLHEPVEPLSGSRELKNWTNAQIRN